MSYITFDNVDKFFGSRQVLHGVSFRVEPGEIVGLLGPNGSGKTTTLRLIAGYYQPDAGQVQVHGRDDAARSGHARPYVGYLPEKAPLYDSLTVLQYLRFVGRCKGLAGHALNTSVDEAVSAFDLSSVARTAIGRLSKGFRQRVGLGQAILGNPAVLLLDEATNGLDPMQIIEARDMIRQAARNRAVVFSSHLMQEVQALCQRALILRHGRLITDVTLASPQATDETTAHLLWAGDAAEPLLGALRTVPGVNRIEVAHKPAATGQYAITLHLARHPESMNALLQVAMAHGQVLEATLGTMNIEDILVRAVRQSDEAARQLESQP